MAIRLSPAFASLLAASLVHCAPHTRSVPERRPEEAVAALARVGRVGVPERVRWSKLRSLEPARSFFFSSYDPDTGVGDLWMLDEASGRPSLLGEQVSYHLTLTGDGRLFLVAAVGAGETGDLREVRLLDGGVREVDHGVSRFGLELDRTQRSGVYLARLSGGRGELTVLPLGSLRPAVVAREVSDFRVDASRAEVLFVEQPPGGRGELRVAPLPSGPVGDVGPAAGPRVPGRVVACADAPP